MAILQGLSCNNDRDVIAVERRLIQRSFERARTDISTTPRLNNYEKVHGPGVTLFSDRRSR